MFDLLSNNPSRNNHSINTGLLPDILHRVGREGGEEAGQDDSEGRHGHILSSQLRDKHYDHFR